MQSYKPIVLFDIDYTLFDTDFFKKSKFSKHKIYREVAGVLENLDKIAILGILSKGQSEFQKNKLEKTGIAKFFKKENIHIFDDKNINLGSTINKYKNSKIFIVDDKLEILHSAKTYMNQVFTIWIKRGPYAEEESGIEGFNPDRKIDDLAGLVPFVQSICAEFSERTNKVRSSLA